MLLLFMLELIKAANSSCFSLLQSLPHENRETESKQRGAEQKWLTATLKYNPRLFYSQCPFMDERILSLHQKIKSQPVELPPQ